jgi:predicted ester cyclase
MGFKEWMTSARTSFPDLQGTIEDMLLANDDYVIGRVTWRGIQQGPFAGIPPTHQAATLPVIHIVRLEGNTIVEWCGIADLFGAVLQLGGKVVLE